MKMAWARCSFTSVCGRGSAAAAPMRPCPGRASAERQDVDSLHQSSILYRIIHQQPFTAHHINPKEGKQEASVRCVKARTLLAMDPHTMSTPVTVQLQCSTRAQLVRSTVP